jgi:hypothetical protein
MVRKASRPVYRRERESRRNAGFPQGTVVNVAAQSEAAEKLRPDCDCRQKQAD